MELSKLEEVLKDEPKFRLKQIDEAIYDKAIAGWDEATTLSKPLREKLKKECPLGIKGKIFKSEDGKTEKALIGKVEAVLMKHKDGRATVCVSCQEGCPMGCSFCATGKMGFCRNLTAEEMVSQVLFFKRQGEDISNVVFMGMGEPFLNYDEVLKAVRILNSKMGLGARRISISTCGIIDGIKKLAKEDLQVNLALSLHAPNNKLRSQLMPVNNRYSLDKVLSAINDYIKRTNRRVMLEYVMLDKVNDSEEHAKELAWLLKNSLSGLYMVNLINYNQTGKYKPSENIEKFKEVLEQEHVPVTRRYSFGQDIKGACGQLATKK